MVKKKYDFLIVGAGLFGSVCARELTDLGFKCLVVDKRNHIGGNCYTEKKEGINVHIYGPHIFHTSNKEVWDYVNRFIKFNNYRHHVIANYKGELYSLPFNLFTFNKLWNLNTPEEVKKKIDEQKFTEEPKNLEEQAISLVGEEIYEKFIKGYTTKQWMKDPKELPPFIIKRLPVRLTFDNNYFFDKYQGIPENGYTELFDKLLEGIDIRLNSDFFEEKEFLNEISEKIIFTGQIDKFFDYKFGHLEYRPLEFKHEVLNIENYQGVAQMNFTDIEVPHTRIIEHKHFENSDSKKTIITTEYPINWDKDKEPYYPINDDTNQKIYELYFEESKKIKNVFFGGRLAEYKYYDMDEVIESALRRIFLFQKNSLL
jgi:UDP-galactopyranose mutase